MGTNPLTSILTKQTNTFIKVVNMYLLWHIDDLGRDIVNTTQFGKYLIMNLQFASLIFHCSSHFTNATWASWRLKAQKNSMFVVHVVNANETSKVPKPYSYIGESEIIIPFWCISYSSDAMSGRYIDNIESHCRNDVNHSMSILCLYGYDDIDTLKSPC